MHEQIPEKYRQYWKPYKTDKILLHLTTKVNFENIKKIGYIEPRDPSPKYWAGMRGIFLADPDDPLYAESLKHVLAHVKEKHEELLRLHIRTKNDFYRSIDPARTFQVMSPTLSEPLCVEVSMHFKKTDKRTLRFGVIFSILLLLIYDNAFNFSTGR